VSKHPGVQKEEFNIVIMLALSKAGEEEKFSQPSHAAARLD